MCVLSRFLFQFLLYCIETVYIGAYVREFVRPLDLRRAVKRLYCIHELKVFHFFFKHREITLITPISIPVLLADRLHIIDVQTSLNIPVENITLVVDDVF